MATLHHSEDEEFFAEYPELKDLPQQLQSGLTSSTSSQTSLASNPPRSALPGTPPTSPETSPASSLPRYGLSGTHPISSRTCPASKPPTRKARVRLTAAQKLDRHKRAEAVRRNMIGKDYTNLRDDWTPQEFKLPVNKWHCKKESLIAAADWLEQLQQGNDDLENTYNALTDVHGLLTEGYPTAQTQLQQQQLPSPPLSQSPPDQQPGAWSQLSFPEYGQWEYLNQQPIYLSQQQATPPPPPQPNQGYGYEYPPLPQDDRMVLEEDFMKMT